MGAINSLICFNNNRTTLLHPEVKAYMDLAEKIPFDQVYEEARSSVAAMLNCPTKDICFTGSASMAIQQGIRLVYEKISHRGRHIITCLTEHPAVLETIEQLRKQGARVSYLGVDREGLADRDELKKLICDDTVMLCLMAANNETGVIHPFQELGELCHDKQIFFFSDASQYVGKLPIDLTDAPFDGLAFGAHKMYGPAGIGALYVRGNALRHKESRPEKRLLAGFGKACDIFMRDHWELGADQSRLRAFLEHQLLDVPGLRINGSTRHRLYNTSNLTLPPGTDLLKLKSRFDFADNMRKPSHVLAAMGISQHDNLNSCRFSFGRYNNTGEVKAFVEELLYSSHQH